AGHRARGLRPVARADRRTLIRRAYFDLIGLPPEPDRVEGFVADARPDAFAQLVDELLASPRYGERWGRYWLDLARYADTAGDTLTTTGQVVLGLSLRCARCHDHKYDPITARDYYALYGFFAGTRYPFAGAEEDRRPSELAPLVPPDRLKDFEGRHAETLARL